MVHANLVIVHFWIQEFLLWIYYIGGQTHHF